MTVERIDSSSDVAEALGLSAATIQKYAREGLIPFNMTPGGHRRFNITEVSEALNQKAIESMREVEANPMVKRVDLWAEIEKNAARLGIVLAMFDIAVEKYTAFCKEHGWQDERGKVGRPPGPGTEQHQHERRPRAKRQAQEATSN